MTRDETSQRKNMHHTQYRLVMVFVFLALVFISVLMILYYREGREIKSERLNSFTVGDNKDIRYKIDYQGQNQDGTYSVIGWCVKPGKVYSYYNYGNDATRASVYNNMRIGFTDGQMVYILPTKLENRDDVDQSINDGTDYQFCGFRSMIPKDQVGRIEEGSLVLIWKNPGGSEELYYI